MKKNKLFVFFTILFLLLVFSFPANARRDGPRGIKNQIPNVMVVRIYFQDRSDLDYLASRYDVWEVHHEDRWLIAQVLETQIDDLRSQGYSVEIDPIRTEKLDDLSPANPDEAGIPGFSCYRTVEETYDTLQNLENHYPNLAMRIDIGDSWEKTQAEGEPGYDLWVLVLTNQSIPGPKPRFFLMGAVHAREYATAETVTRFAEYLLSNYGSDPDVTWFLDYYEVHLLAQANPDGRKKAESGDSWRKNTDRDDGCNIETSWGVDLNRNSSFEWGGIGTSSYACDSTYHGPSPASEPEIQAMETYVRSLFPDQRGPNETDPAPMETPGLFITLHSYGELILWPWGHTSIQAPNHLQLQTLGRKMAYFNYYWPQQSYELYGTSGTNDEFAYGELGVAAYTFEMGVEFFEPCGGFEDVIYPNNQAALKTALKATRRPYQEPAGPDVINLSLSSPIIQQGLPVTLTVQLDDSRYSKNNGQEASQPIQSAEVSIDFPQWFSPQPISIPFLSSDGAFDEIDEQAFVVIDTGSLDLGKHQLFVRATDTVGNIGMISSTFLEVIPGTPIIRDVFIYLPWISHAP